MLRWTSLVFLAAVAGCGGTAPSKTASPATTAATPATPSRVAASPARIAVPDAFRYIPASTPYLMAGDMDTTWMRNRVAVFGYALQEIYRDLKSKRGTFTGDDAKIFDGLFDLLGDDLTTASFARLGIPTLPRTFVYGIGILPAFRMPLTSGKKLHAALERVRALAGPAFPAPRTVPGVTYWYFPDVTEFPNKTGPKASLSVAVAIVGDQLVAGLVVEALKDEMLPLLFGTKLPAQSLANSAHVQHLLRRYQIKAKHLVFLDVLEGARQLFGGAQGLSERIAFELRGRQPSHYSPLCRKELTALAALMPRIVGGSYTSSKDGASGRLVVELDDDVIHALRSSLGEIPGGDLAQLRAPAAFGIGLDTEQLGAQLVTAARRIQKSPYQCPDLSGLNQAASAMAGVAIEPILKQFGSPTGFSFVFTKFESQPFDVAGAMVISGRDPAALWQTVQTQVPGLSQVQVDVGDPPMRAAIVPSGPMSLMYWARTDTSLGVSVGAGSDHTLSQLTTAGNRSDRAFAVMYYDDNFTQSDSNQKLLDNLRKWGLHTAAARVEARFAAMPTISRGSFIMRIGKHGLTAEYDNWDVKR